MNLQEFTAINDLNDPTKIIQVRFSVADHSDQEQQKEWIAVQLSVDLPTVLNGAFLRSKALEKARDILAQLVKDFEHLGYERHAAPEDQP